MYETNVMKVKTKSGEENGRSELLETEVVFALGVLIAHPSTPVYATAWTILSLFRVRLLSPFHDARTITVKASIRSRYAALLRFGLPSLPIRSHSLNEFDLEVEMERDAESRCDPHSL